MCVCQNGVLVVYTCLSFIISTFMNIFLILFLGIYLHCCVSPNAFVCIHWVNINFVIVNKLPSPCLCLDNLCLSVNLHVCFGASISVCRSDMLLCLLISMLCHPIYTHIDKRRWHNIYNLYIYILFGIFFSFFFFSFFFSDLISVCLSVCSV